jgi:hypothetical protein
MVLCCQKFQPTKTDISLQPSNEKGASMELLQNLGHKT